MSEGGGEGEEMLSVGYNRYMMRMVASEKRKSAGPPPPPPLVCPPARQHLSQCEPLLAMF